MASISELEETKRELERQMSDASSLIEAKKKEIADLVGQARNTVIPKAREELAQRLAEVQEQLRLLGKNEPAHAAWDAPLWATWQPDGEQDASMLRIGELRGTVMDIALRVPAYAPFVGGGSTLLIPDGAQRPMEEPGDGLHVIGMHTPGGQGRSPDADAAGDRRLLWIEGDGVLIDRNACPIEGFLGGLAGHTAGSEIHEDKVIVGASGHQPVAVRHEFRSERPAVVDDALLVFAERRLQCFAKCDGLGRVQWTPATEADDTIHASVAAAGGSFFTIEGAGIFGHPIEHEGLGEVR